MIKRATTSTRAPGVFMVCFVLYFVAAVLWLLLGLVPAFVERLPAVHERLHRSGGVVDHTAIVVWKHAFNFREIALPAGRPVTISLFNGDSDRRHKLSIYTDRSAAAPIFVGSPLLPSSGQNYTFTAPAPGAYYFRCDLHPEMNGTVRVVPVASGALPGTRVEAAAAYVARKIALTAHNSEAPARIVAAYLFSLLNLGLGLVLIRLRPRILAARLLAVGMVGTGAVFNLQGHQSYYVLPAQVVAEVLHTYLFHLAGGVAYVYALLLFPDGKLVPRLRGRARAARSLRWLYLLLLTVIGVVGGMAVGDGHPETFVLFFGLMIPITGLMSQAIRFQHAANATEREQSRLLMIALSIAFGLALLWLGLSNGVALLGTADSGPAWQARQIVFLIFPALFVVLPLLLFVILVRYRLWDIDALINRTLVYTILTGLLALVYFASVVLLQGLVQPLLGDLLPQVAPVLSTLAIAAVFQPLRGQIQRFIDRRYNRRKYDSSLTLQAFSATVRAEVDLDALTADLVAVVLETMQPAQVSCWVRSPQDHTRRGFHDGASRSGSSGTEAAAT